MSADDGGQGRWQLRSHPADVVARYQAEGWWTDETLGMMVERGLASKLDEAFRVLSDVRPWTGTLGDVDRAARRLAGVASRSGDRPR